MELTSITPGPEALRALSHPVRLRLLGLLRMDGPSTASALATRLGLNSGATSYHLRQLAQHGFVVDARRAATAATGGGARRTSRPACPPTTPPRTPDERDANDAFVQAVAIVRTEQLQQAVEERPLLPPSGGPPPRSATGASADPGPRPGAHAGDVRGRRGVGGGRGGPDGAEPFIVALTTPPAPRRCPLPRRAGVDGD